MRPKIHPKLWGEEHWISNGKYCGKKLLLKKSFRCSLHYHKRKSETFYLQRGLIILEVPPNHYLLIPGDYLDIPKGTRHRFWGLDDSEIFEFSSHHSDKDSYREIPSGPFEKDQIPTRLRKPPK